MISTMFNLPKSAVFVVQGTGDVVQFNMDVQEVMSCLKHVNFRVGWARDYEIWPNETGVLQPSTKQDSRFD